MLSILRIKNLALVADLRSASLSLYWMTHFVPPT